MLRDKLKGFSSELPLEEASTIPAPWYWDGEIYQGEMNALFRRSWQLVGRVDQVAEPGQFFTAEVAGDPILVARNKAGVLKAMANVCRHRAARVEIRAEGKAPCFQCRYHGWVYDLDGQLKGAPEFDGAKNFVRQEVALPPWQVDTWGPWVFVHHGTPEQPLAEAMAHVGPRMPEVDFSRYWFYRRVSYDLHCNWKVYVDNYLDGGYHVRTIHPSLGAVIDYARYHSVLYDRSSVQVSPLVASASAELSSVRSGHQAYYWWFHPNWMLNVYERTLDINLVIPRGKDHCTVHIDFFATGPKDAACDAFMTESIAAAHQIQKEDVEICEEVYRGLQGPSYSTGRFSPKREAPGYLFHQVLARDLHRGTQP